MYRFVLSRLLGIRELGCTEGGLPLERSHSDQGVYCLSGSKLLLASDCMPEEPPRVTEEEMRLQAARDVLCNEDLLKLLFEKLGREGLCSAGATCRQWREVAESDEFWTSLDVTGLNISPWQARSLLSLLFACPFAVASRRPFHAHLQFQHKLTSL